ncbi:MAG: Wzz/FepE/Etk N-terminal domain-containing protein [Flavobacterium sp.]
MTQTNNENNKIANISLLPIVAVLKKEYKTILIVTLFFPIIGFFYALNIPKEYTSTGKIMPEVSYKAPNGMAGLYNLLKKFNNNVDLYNTEITNPELHAEILNTNDFYNYILSKKVRTSSNKSITFKSYCDTNLKNQNSFIEKGNSNSTTNDKIKYDGTIRDIQKRIVTTTNKKNNLTIISVKMQDPSVAADIANFTITYLIDYITQYRTEKARKELHFIENLQKNVSTDSSENGSSAKEIQNSLLAASVQMKIQIQEDTPIIQVLEKAQIPVSSSNTPISTILTAAVLFGLLIGTIIAFLKNNNYKMFLN